MGAPAGHLVELHDMLERESDQESKSDLHW